MKYLLLTIIKAYWRLIPESKRRKCLFEISCSNYVYDTTKVDGLILGIKALKFRFRNCNQHYSILNINGEKVLITKTNKIFKESEINKTILN